MTRARPVLRTLTVTVVTVLAFAACGDDDADDASAATTTTTEADPTTTIADEAADDPAEDPTPDEPDDPGEGDGLGDPLVFVADLTGETEVPGPGDDGASGRVEIESAVSGEWCFDMEASDLSAEVTDAHIHFGPVGNSGDVVIPIGEPTSVDDDTDVWEDVCLAVEEDLVAEILDAPDAFYANIHTAAFGGGAIRGQLEAATIFDLTLS